MAEYYLISQLPSLDGLGDSAPLPIDEDRFLALCRFFLGTKAQKAMQELTIAPPKEPSATSSALLSLWYEKERELRLALGKVRAEKLHKAFDYQNKSFSTELMKIVNDAVENTSPLEAEKLLFSYRISVLEALRPTDMFCEDYVFYYGLKLKLLARMRVFDTARGESAYRKIYNSILTGERTEVNP